jgi:hypothetical protein
MQSAKKDLMPQLRDEAYHKMTESDNLMSWKEMTEMLRETFGRLRQSEP